MLIKQFAGTPVEAKVAATCTLTTVFQEFGIETDAVQEVAELCVGCIYNFALAIEVRICMNLDGFIGVNVLQEPFELNGFRQVIVLFRDAADEESFRLISGLNFYLGKENCYWDHLQLFCAAKVHSKDSVKLCNIFFENYFRKRKKRAGSAEKSAKPAL